MSTKYPFHRTWLAARREKKVREERKGDKDIPSRVKAAERDIRASPAKKVPNAAERGDHSEFYELSKGKRSLGRVRWGEKNHEFGKVRDISLQRCRRLTSTEKGE